MLRFCLVAVVAFVLASFGMAPATAQDTPRSSPKDGTPYTRPAVPDDYTLGYAMALVFPSVFLVDVVVNNTDLTLAGTDTNNDGETSIAVNPADPNEIVVTAFSGSAGGNALLWHSTDGGLTWTRQFTVPAPPGVAGWVGCPGANTCDQTVD